MIMEEKEQFEEHSRFNESTKWKIYSFAIFGFIIFLIVLLILLRIVLVDNIPYFETIEIIKE